MPPYRTIPSNEEPDYLNRLFLMISRISSTPPCPPDPPDVGGAGGVGGWGGCPLPIASSQQAI